MYYNNEHDWRSIMYNIRNHRHELIAQVSKVVANKIINSVDGEFQVITTRERGMGAVYLFNEAFAWGKKDFAIQIYEYYYMVEK